MKSCEKLNGEWVLPCNIVRELDRTAITTFGIPGLLLMENAARGITEVVMKLLGEQKSLTVLIFCGIGNNAGDGLAVARLLQVRNIPCRVVLCADPARFRGDALFQYELVKRLKIPMDPLFDAPSAEDVIHQLDLLFPKTDSFLSIDALLGTGASGPPRVPMNGVITWLNSRCKGRILAVDVPTGLNCDSGEPFSENPAEVIHASRTVTLSAYKPGLITEKVRDFTGIVTVADIGICVESLLNCNT